MARSSGLVGESLLGMSKGSKRAPNTFSLVRYFVILFLVIVGGIYAAPNLFQPDPALQIKSTNKANPMDQSVIDRAVAELRSQGIAVTGSEVTGDAGLIRVDSDENQLRGRDLIAAVLNPKSDGRYVVALNRASTTPRWLRDIGGKPMSLGLDLSGGVHFLLQVDMEKFLGDRMRNNAEAIRDLLVDERIRYVGRDWVVDQQLHIGFQSEQARDTAHDIIASSYNDFQILDRPVGNRPGLRLSLQDAKVRELEDLAISQNLQSLRKRVNELGVSEPLV
ncbi:MAG: protein translocase subunit SecD, partial [Gammaproteobacteria bacterium]|nr:protein translocase subunit SecD [Gammaproteobacteria bacterium]